MDPQSDIPRASLRGEDRVARRQPSRDQQQACEKYPYALESVMVTVQQFDPEVFRDLNVSTLATEFPSLPI